MPDDRLLQGPRTAVVQERGVTLTSHAVAEAPKRRSAPFAQDSRATHSLVGQLDSEIVKSQVCVGCYDMLRGVRRQLRPMTRRAAEIGKKLQARRVFLRTHQRDPSRQIRDSDLDRAKKALQGDFKKIFTEELQQGGRYQVTDSGGPDVLVLRPALINIQVSAPDLMSPGRSATFVQSAGTMTIYLELWDSASNTILARVIDGKVDPGLYGQRSSSVTNRAAADRMMRSWADELRSRLDLVRGKDVAP
jgi:hypothetical protein